MVVEEVANVSVGLITEIGQIALWLQAIGVMVVLWIIVQAVTIWYEAKRMKQVLEIKKDMVRIESKINKILAKR
ncbi:MAG TPA: hypothetical protein VHA12_02365 [Candidatus Nanoarchaeia archaeon]|nr:hypothetical protein [Candidatus Nanoarchaeia archaeon]